MNFPSLKVLLLHRIASHFTTVDGIQMYCACITNVDVKEQLMQTWTTRSTIVTTRKLIEATLHVHSSVTRSMGSMIISRSEERKRARLVFEIQDEGVDLLLLLDSKEEISAHKSKAHRTARFVLH